MSRKRSRPPMRVPPAPRVGARDPRGGPCPRPPAPAWEGLPAGLPPSAPAGALATGLICLTVYLFTLAPGLYCGDSADLQTAAGSLGIAHPPGYPTYTMLGWVFGRLSADNPAWGVNLMTAAFGALAAAALFLATAELTGLATAGLAAGLALGLAPLFWQYSVVAEVFTMNAFFAGLLLWLALRLQERPSAGNLAVGAGVLGLAFSHHHTIVLLTPTLALLAWRARPKVDWRAPAAFCAGLLPYLYPLLRARANPPLNWDDPHTLGGLVHLVTRADYGTMSLLPGAARVHFGETSRLAQIPTWLSTMFAGPEALVALLALGGAAWLVFRDRLLGAAVLLFAALAGPGFLMLANYPLEDPFWIGVVERFYLLPQVAVALLAGCAVAALGRWLPERAAGPAGLALAALVAGAGLAQWGAVDRSGNTVAQDYVANLLLSVPERALVLTVGDAPGMLLEYATAVEGRRPDVVILDQDKLGYPWYVDSKRRRHPDVVFPWKAYDGGRQATMADLVAANYGTRPIVFWRFLDGSLNGRFRLLPAGLVQRVADPGEEPAPEQLAAEVERLWDSYEKRSLAGRYSPRSFDHLVTSFYGFPFYSVAYEFERAGKSGPAVAFYRMAVEAAPHYALPYRRLAALEASRGQRQAARDLFQRYLDLEPNAADAADVRAAMEGL